MKPNKVVIIGLVFFAATPAFAQTVSLRVDTVRQAEWKTADSTKTVTQIVLAKASVATLRQFSSENLGKKIKVAVDGAPIWSGVIREQITSSELNISPPILVNIPTGSTLVVEVTD